MRKKGILTILIVLVAIIIVWVAFLIIKKPAEKKPPEIISGPQISPSEEKKEKELSQEKKQDLGIEPLTKATLKILSDEEKEKLGIGPQTKIFNKILTTEEKKAKGISENQEVIIRNLSIKEKERLGLDPKLTIIVQLTLSQEENIANRFEVFKKKHPELSAPQLEVYKELALKKNIKPCRDRPDRVDCISAVAFLTERYDLCGHELEEDTKAKIECLNSILLEKADSEVNKCNSSFDNDDLKTECLTKIFQMYKRPENCSSFKTEKTRKICRGVLYYQMALMQGKKELCDKIEDDYLKTYCSKLVY